MPKGNLTGVSPLNDPVSVIPTLLDSRRFFSVPDIILCALHTLLHVIQLLCVGSTIISSISQVRKSRDRELQQVV